MENPLDEFIRDSAINPIEYIKQKQTQMLEMMLEKAKEYAKDSDNR